MLHYLGKIGNYTARLTEFTMNIRSHLQHRTSMDQQTRDMANADIKSSRSKLSDEMFSKTQVPVISEEWLRTLAILQPLKRNSCSHGLMRQHYSVHG